MPGRGRVAERAGCELWRRLITMPWLPTMLLCVCWCAVGLGPAAAHSSLSMPMAMSRTTACRISSGAFAAHCPGPCPNGNRRLDAVPENPSAMYKRGGLYEMRWLRNNHEGGFIRWSLVKVEQMWDRNAHARNAFHWQCWDTGRRRCTKENRSRDCFYDRKDQFFSNHIKIPTHLPDGDYILSFAWYGGGGKWGDFGDYYDCAFVRIKDGPLTQTWQPTMQSGNGSVGKNGKCLATVNRLGVCWREPCPGGGKFSKMLPPAEFENGKRPALLRRSWFGPHQTWKTGGFGIWRLRLMKVDGDQKVLASATHRKTVVMYITRADRVTVVADVFGPVTSVTFFNNGRQARTAYGPKYSIAGDWGKNSYAPWQFWFEKKLTVIAAKATSKWGGVRWVNMELVAL